MVACGIPMPENRKTLKRCRTLLLVQAGFFACACGITIISMAIDAQGAQALTKTLYACWCLCVAMVFALYPPIAKSAVCVKCGKSLLLSHMDSRRNTLPLFQIMFGQTPLCRECALAVHNAPQNELAKEKTR